MRRRQQLDALVLELLQRLLDQPAQVRFVVHDQDRPAHGSSYWYTRKRTFSIPFSKRSIRTASERAGRHGVQHDDVGLQRQRLLDEVVAARLDHAVAARGEHVGQRLDRGRVLVDHQHALVRLLLLDQRADLAEQQVGVDRLGQVAIDAEPEAALAVLHDRQDHDRDVHRRRVVLQHGGDVEAVHLRHHHVEHDQVGPLGAAPRRSPRGRWRPCARRSRPR